MDEWKMGPLSSRTPGSAHSSDEAVEKVVRELNAISKAASLEFAFAVGEILVANFFEGDIYRLRSHDPRKNASLRKLAKHPDLRISRGTLYRSIAIHQLCGRLDIRQWKHVSTSHIRLVLPLPEDAQKNLLHQTEVNAWTTRRLEEEITMLVRDLPSGHRRAGPRRGSGLRRAAKCLTKSIEAMAACFDKTQNTIEPAPESIMAAKTSLEHACDFQQTFAESLAKKTRPA